MLCAHTCACACEFAAHTQISSEILSILVLMSWNSFKKKKKIKQLRARLVGWDGDIPPYVVQQSLSKMLCVPLSPFWPKLDGGGILTTAGACCGQHTANAGAAACCSVPVMLCKLQA